MRTGRNLDSKIVRKDKVYYIRICALAGTQSVMKQFKQVVYYIRICALAGTQRYIRQRHIRVYYIRICALA